MSSLRKDVKEMLTERRERSSQDEVERWQVSPTRILFHPSNLVESFLERVASSVELQALRLVLVLVQPRGERLALGSVEVLCEALKVSDDVAIGAGERKGAEEVPFPASEVVSSALKRASGRRTLRDSRV